MPSISINNCNFNYQDSGKGPTVVLLHGFPLDMGVWQPVAKQLQNSCRVILIDIRGFGKSVSNSPFTMDSLAQDINGLLGKINALPCYLGGLSMGGYVAMAYCSQFASTMKGLILVDTKAEADSPEGKAGRLKMIEMVKTSGSKAVADQMMPKMICDATRTHLPQVVQQLQQIMEACPPATIAHAQQAMHDRIDYMPLLRKLPFPSLMICGQEDAISPLAIAQQMAAAMPQGTLAVIPNAGHMSPIEQPKAVADAIATFVGIG